MLVGNELVVDPELGEGVLMIPPVGLALGEKVGTTDWPVIVGIEEGVAVVITTAAVGDSDTAVIGPDDIDGTALDVGAPVGLAVTVGAFVMVGARLGATLDDGAFVLVLPFFDDFFPDFDRLDDDDFFDDFFPDPLLFPFELVEEDFPFPFEL